MRRHNAPAEVAGYVVRDQVAEVASHREVNERKTPSQPPINAYNSVSAARLGQCMLKSLELVGFKSFADRTRLPFGTGLTAIVGPNGSGKSNIVDAIRWILGEQSAKSLRGKEMADVIFNGSASRRPMGMAEVSLTVDNRRRSLPLDCDEVVITRRVYRNGEGEYLLNGAVSRLRDIKELFLGTGAAGGAYSIIEQGKVDAMLQASTKDRRIIFEEAAGVSRFRVKKIETLRRLDRVEQNLLRVTDIREEVEKHVHTLRSQAGKARKYRELTEQLRTWRTQVGLSDYQRLSAELDEIEQRLAVVKPKVAEHAGQIASLDGELQSLEAEIARQEESERALASRLGAVREQISALETESASDHTRADELTGERLASLRHLQETRGRLKGRQQSLQTLTQEVEKEQQAFTTHAAELAQKQAELADTTARLEALERQRKHLETAAEQGRSELARLENEQAALESQLSFLWQHQQRLTEKRRALVARAQVLGVHRAALDRQEQAIQGQLAACAGGVDDLRRQHGTMHAAQRAAVARLAELRERRSGLASRIDVLQSLQRRHEGLQGGVREALERKAQGDPRWQVVLGAVAELLEVDGQYADLVELALGPAAQALVVTQADDVSDHLVAAAGELAGRVNVTPIEAPEAGPMVVVDDDSRWQPLTALVACDDRLRPLVDRLLGATFLVEDYPSARQAAETTAEVRFLTSAGEIIEPDGSVSAGSRDGSAGVLARAAELRSLERQVADLSVAITDAECALSDCEHRLAAFEGLLDRQQLLQGTLAEQRRHLAAAAAALRRERQGLEVELLAVDEELQDARRQIGDLEQQCRRVDLTLTERHDALQRISTAAETCRTALEECRSIDAALSSAVTSLRVELAGAEQRLAGELARKEQLAAELAQFRLDWTEQLAHAEQLGSRAAQLGRRLLHSAATLAELYCQKDALTQGAGYDPGLLAAARAKRQQIAERLHESRNIVETGQRQLHAWELRQTELRLARDGIAERLREEYRIEAGELLADFVAPSAEELSQARAGVDELKQKIARLGAVNLQAIEELEQLEQRLESIDFQLSDLASAKRHLEEVIARINEESRRLFLDTFESVREHFQGLFRTLFGGGKADLLLEDETDVLETGIEVIARPPGKEPRSISLLSGGEKTLTAVALLMALFRAKPSPFCILDEVDAALDEANIGRYVAALKEFVHQSQFILITHSKTTMAAADVLHGITQRESGVSIRVSVNLDRVAADGRILDEPAELAAERAPQPYSSR